jgi:ketosteroid isomerase-like protein
MTQASSFTNHVTKITIRALLTITTMAHLKIVITLFALLVSATLFAQNKPNVDDKSLAYLEKFRTDYSKSLVEKKPEAIQIYYAENVRLMPELQKTVMGKENSLMYHKAFLSRFDVLEYSREETEVFDLGTQIVEIGLFTLKIRVKNSNKEHVVKGKYHNFWQKKNNSAHILLTEAWNYNHQLEFEDQIRFEEVPTTDIALKAHLPINSNVTFELAALNRLMEATVSQHDAKIWSQFYTEDGGFFYSRNSPIKGKRELEQFLESHTKDLPVFEKLDIRNDQVDESGKYVIEYASHIAIIRHGDFSGVFTGKDLRIWRRESNGSLKIFRHIGMYD